MAMNTPTNTIPALADLPSDDYRDLEDRIMARALAMWRKKGHGHRNVLTALRQAERELLAGKNQAVSVTGGKVKPANPFIKTN